jgi:hypothetical protein
MQMQHKQSTIDWQKKVRQFVDTELIPWEIEAEMNKGVIPDAATKICRVRQLRWVYQRWMHPPNMAA